MSRILANSATRRGVIVAAGMLVCCLALGTAGVLAQAKSEEKKPAANGKVEKDIWDQTIAFEMRAKPWASVFEWLTEKTGLPFISNHQPPTGTFNFISKTGQKYSYSQVIDIINEGLLAHKYTLIRRDTAFTLIPADEKIDPVLLPRIRLEELPKRGSTEIVSLVLPLQTLVAEDFAPEVKKMMGPFGEVVALAKANQLVLQDTVGNLRRILKTVSDIEDIEKTGQAETFAHKCLYIRARDAEATLRNFLGDPKQVIEMTRPATPMGTGAGTPPFGREERPRPVAKIRMHYVTSDDRTNTVYVNGPADKIAQAKAVIAKLDVAQYKGQQPIAVGQPFLQTYPVPAGNAEALVKTLSEIYKGTAGIRISAISTNQVMVWASPEDHFDVAKHMQGLRPPAAATELIPLTFLDSTRVAETLKAAYPDSKNGAPYIEADPTRNAIIVKGSTEQVTDVKMFIKAIGESKEAQSGNMRVLILEKGSAATLAEALERLFPQIRDNPLKVILPGGELAPRKEEAPAPKQLPKPHSLPRLENGSGATQPILFIDDGEAKKKEPPKGKAKAPVTITAFGNKLIVTSDDPEALALVSELIRLLTQTQPGEGDFEVVRLRYANAVDTAKILDEAFNGPKTTGQARKGPETGGFPIPGLSGGIGGILGSALGIGGGGGGGQAQRVERIRVVADAATNSLLVKASPLDMLTIRNLLSKALDTGVTDSNAVIKTFVIGPLKYAAAVDVANVIRDVYRESMNNNLRGIGQVQGVGFPFGGAQRSPLQNVDQHGNPKGVTLSVGIDDKTNSIIVAAPTPMFEDIKKLVEQLEIAASDSRQSVKVVSIKGVDPQLVQQALDAIQGRSSSSRRTQSQSDGGVNFTPFGGSGVISPFRTFPFGGGLFPGGGGLQQGGGGGFRDRMRDRGIGGPQSRGPDFFEQRVMDDPQPILFDPHLEPAFPAIPRDIEPFVTPASHQGQASQRPLNWGEGAGSNSGEFGYRHAWGAGRGEGRDGYIQLAVGEKGKPMPPADKEGVIAPRLPVTAEALEQLGIVVLRANNPADLEAALKIIEFIQKEGAKAEVEINLVPLRTADATSVTSILNQLFARVVVGPNATTHVTAPARQQAQPQQQQQQQVQVQVGTGQQPQAQQAVATSVVFIALPRQNSILIAAPRSRIPDIIKEINRLDVPLTTDGKAVAFPLKRAAASRVANLITTFYSDRFPNETRAQHQIRVTYDDQTNTVFVQAAPADLVEIRNLIDRIDNTVSSAVNDLRIVPLRNAVSDDLANLISRAIADGFTATGGGGLQQAGGLGQLGGLGGLGGQSGLGGLGLGQAGAGQGGLGQTGVGLTGIPRQTKVSSLRFLAPRKDGPRVLETGILEDIRITSDPRINALVIAAPEKTMELILALVKELDTPPAARAEINIFTLKKADAVQTALTLQQLFLGTGGLGGTGARTGGVPGAPGAGGVGAGLGVGGVGAGLGATLGQPRPLQLTLTGTTPEGAPLIDLRLTVDERSNSLVVAGSRNDLDVIEAIIAKLEDADVQNRRNEAIKLRNALAADVAVTLNDFVTKSLSVLQKGNQLTSFQEIQKDVVITAEPISNTLLISASPQYMSEILRLVNELDAVPPQVVIQVLVAEVDLTDTNEFGVEIGLQSPVLFRRGIVPFQQFLGSGTIGFSPFTDANGNVAPGTMVPGGVTVNNTVNPTAVPGFNFNNTGPLGNNPVVNPHHVGFQGLGNLGVGRISPSNTIGGFVFSAASDSVNLLVRALKTQGRIDILSRPQIMTLDNQTALINVGQEIPIVTSSNVTSTGVISNNIDRRQVGVILQVTPKISPDGRVLMRIVPEISSVVPTPVPLGNGQIGTALNIQHLETTVSAFDGETVALGGLIAKKDVKNENKIPWFGDLPVVGALFRFRTQSKSKTELLIILTPHVVRTREDAERVLAEESRKMNWILGDVLKFQGHSCIDPFPHGALPQGLFPPMPQPVVPGEKNGKPGEEIPAPQPVPRTPPPPPAPAIKAPPADETPPSPSGTPKALPEGPSLLPGPLQVVPMGAPESSSKVERTPPGPDHSAAPPVVPPLPAVVETQADGPGSPITQTSGQAAGTSPRLSKAAQRGLANPPPPLPSSVLEAPLLAPGSTQARQ